MTCLFGRSLISSDDLRPEGSISRKVWPGTAVGRGTFLRSQGARLSRPSPRMETKPIMKRVLVVSFFGLAAAGCAQSRSALTKPDSPPPRAPVAVTPVHSLSQTINRGMGNPAVVRSAIKDPDSPKWSGRAQVTAEWAVRRARRPARANWQHRLNRPRAGTAAPAALAAQAPGPVGNQALPAEAGDAMTSPRSEPGQRPEYPSPKARAESGGWLSAGF